MSDELEQPGSGSGSGSFAGSGPRAPDSGNRPPGPGTRPGTDYFDHERLEVYRVAREFFIIATAIIQTKIAPNIRDQFDRSSQSILSNIAEGAGKTAKADKRRSYEIARGSTTEAASQLEVLHIRSLITDQQYREARSLLIRVSQMLSRLCADPRTT